MNKLMTRLEYTDLQMGEIECSISEDRLGHVSTLFNAFMSVWERTKGTIKSHK